jgi:hypothetical protein
VVDHVNFDLSIGMDGSDVGLLDAA